MDSISNLIKELGQVPRELEDVELNQAQSNTDAVHHNGSADGED